MATTKTTIKRKFEGTVTSAKADKTIVVAVERTKLDTKYQKRFAVTKKYLVHDENNEFSVGYAVSFVECRPISKNKKWRAISKKESK